jgi:hypothetical protein
MFALTEFENRKQRKNVRSFYGKDISSILNPRIYFKSQIQGNPRLLLRKKLPTINQE